MGYHIIIKVSKGELQHQHVEDYDDLAYITGLSKESIIYQGEKHWEPVMIGKSRYERFAQDWYSAGMKAQQVFRSQAIEQHLILESLSQDQLSFKSYSNKAKTVLIKRGDFLIRNLGNLEIEV